MSLNVEKLEEAANPIFFLGNETGNFQLEPGQHFVVGQTTFSLTDERAFVTQDVPNPISQKTFSPDFLRKVNYRDADRRIKSAISIQGTFNCRPKPCCGIRRSANFTLNLKGSSKFGATP